MSHSFHDSVTGAIVSGELWRGNENKGTIHAKPKNSFVIAAPQAVQRSMLGDEAAKHDTVELARALSKSIDARDGSLAKVLQQLQVDPTSGLSVAEAADRLIKFGQNKLQGDEVCKMCAALMQARAK
jgi:hypothetical protein